MLEPLGCGRHHRRIEAAGGHTDNHAEQQLELEERRRAARADEAKAEERASKQHDEARAEAVGHHAPQEGGGTHAQEIEGGGRRYAAARPAGVRCDRLKENRKRHHRADADAGHQHARADDDPSVRQPHVCTQRACEPRRAEPSTPAIMWPPACVKSNRPSPAGKSDPIRTRSRPCRARRSRRRRARRVRGRAGRSWCRS